MADTPQGETVTPVALSNEPGNVAAPPTDNSNADVENAKREAEQARIRANQLENELKAMRDKQAELDKKQLEEKEEYKTLFEKTDAELKAIREERESQDRQAQLASATNDLFKDYPENVVEVAKTAGISLTDDSEAARTSLKEKLDSLSQKVGSAPTATPNNPTISTPAQTTPDGRLGRPRSLGVDDGSHSFGDNSKAKFSEYVKTIPAIAEMKKQAGISTEN